MKRDPVVNHNAGLIYVSHGEWRYAVPFGYRKTVNPAVRRSYDPVGENGYLGDFSEEVACQEVPGEVLLTARLETSS